MGTIERLEILRDKIKCPQFGDIEYGEWGALRLEQRKAIKDLIDSNKNKDKTINDLLKRISNLEFEVERVNSIIDKLEEHLLEIIKENKDKKDNVSISMVAQTNYIYNYLQVLKGSDKE